MKNNKKLSNNLTEGSILKSLLALSIPIIFANLLQTAYQLIDTFWVGKLGTKAVAAVSISFPIIFLIISLGAGLTMAGGIFVAQYKGKGEHKMVNHIATQTLLGITFVGILLAILGYFLAPLLITLMKVETSVFDQALFYMRVSFVGMVFMFIYMSFQGVMRSVGDVKTPMFIILGTVLLNLVLDPLFIFGYGFVPAYGVAGAAVASIVTQFLSAVIGVAILLRGKHLIQINIHDFKPDFPLLKRMAKIGLPASIEKSTRSLGMIAMTFLVAAFGTTILAAYGIGSRILSFVIIPAMGLSMATATLVGQNIGAGKIKRAEKITKLSTFWGFTTLTVVGIIVFIFATQISAIFIPGQEETIKMSALFIKIMALSFGFIGIQMSMSGVFRGSGNTIVSMILSITSLWLLRFPLAYILSKYTSLEEVGIWLAFPIANVVAAIIAVLWFLKGDWKKKKIIQEAGA